LQQILHKVGSQASLALAVCQIAQWLRFAGRLSHP
jgi:hypothetical protein